LCCFKSTQPSTNSTPKPAQSQAEKGQAKMAAGTVLSQGRKRDKDGRAMVGSPIKQ
jgi:hypothetical protein